MKVNGLVVVVTGGASGLGEATVRLMAEQGCKVAIWDTNRERGMKIAVELGALFVYVDVRNSKNIEDALEQVVKLYGRVDVLLNSAGIFRSDLELTETIQKQMEIYQQVIDINLIGSFNVSRIVANFMKDQELKDGERGLIVFIASIAAFSGGRKMTSYAASKGALVSITLPMARDLQPYKIRVMTVAPGPFTNTNIQGNPIEDLPKRHTQFLASGRSGRNYEFADCVKFLIENQYMNGTTVNLDGGGMIPNI